MSPKAIASKAALVCGAGGFIGHHLVRRLKREGFWVRGADATLSSICAMRRSILARVKFLSRLFTALNLLPSIATLACVSRPIARHSAIN